MPGMAYSTYLLHEQLLLVLLGLQLGGTDDPTDPEQ